MLDLLLPQSILHTNCTFLLHRIPMIPNWTAGECWSSQSSAHPFLETSYISIGIVKRKLKASIRLGGDIIKESRSRRLQRRTCTVNRIGHCMTCMPSTGRTPTSLQRRTTELTAFIDYHTQCRHLFDVRLIHDADKAEIKGAGCR